MISALRSGLRESLGILVILGFLTTLFQMLKPSSISLSCIFPSLFQGLVFWEVVPATWIFAFLNILFSILTVRLILRLTVHYTIIHKSNIFPAFLWIVHTGLGLSDVFSIQTRLWASFFLLLSYLYIAITYKKDSARIDLFYSGFFFIFSIYLDPFFFIFIFFLIIALITYRVVNGKDFLSLFSGMIFSALIVESLLYLNDMPLDFPIFSLVEFFNFSGIPEFFPEHLLLFVPIFLIFNFSIFYVGVQTSGISVFMSKHRQLMIYAALFSTALFLMRCKNWPELFMPASIPFSFLAGEMFYYMNNKIRTFLFYVLLLVYVGYFVVLRIQ